MTLTLKRPKILAKAARVGASIYRRERDLARIAPMAARLGRKRLIARLAGLEKACEDERRAGDEAYSPHKHLRLLSALLAETKAA